MTEKTIEQLMDELHWAKEEIRDKDRKIARLEDDIIECQKEIRRLRTIVRNQEK